MKKFLINLIPKKAPSTRSDFGLGFRNSPKGTTLVEILLYMGILSTFLVVLTDIFVAILNVRSESEATSSLEQDGRFILTRFHYDVSRASSISTPSSLGQTTTTLSMIIGGVTYSYSESSGNLILSNNFGSNNLNSSETTISNPQFTRIGNSSVPQTKDNIKIEFTLNSKTQRKDGPQTKTFVTTVGRR